MHALSARLLEKRGAGVGLVPALTKAGIFASLLLRGIDRFAKRTRSASPRQGELTDLRSKRGWRRWAVACAYKTGNFAHVEKRGKIINSLWKSLLKTLIYNGFRILLFQGDKKTLFLNFYKNHRKTRHFSLFPIKRENLH